MFIIDFFKAINTIKQAKKFTKTHEGTVKQVIEKTQNAVGWFENHKTDIQIKIDTAKGVIEKLKGFLHK